MKKTKFIVLLLVLAICLPVLAACNTATPDDVLYVYNWEDYISEDLIKAFEEKYSVTVEVPTFDTNETMITNLVDGKQSYDIICPSDYAIQQLIKRKLLEPLDKDKLPVYFENVSYGVHDKFEGIITDDADNLYAIGYMWGIMGILYNVEKLEEKGFSVENDNIDTWGLLFEEEFKGQVYMKDSIRDTFAALSLWAYREELASGELKPQDVLSNDKDGLIDRVKAVFKEQKSKVSPLFEVDEAKNSLAEGQYAMALMWSGDAYESILNAAEKGIELGFAYPTEGNNIFFDGLAIPKNDKRTDAKRDLIYKFLNFISEPENAAVNMEATGYTSVIAGTGTTVDDNPILKYAHVSEEEGGEVNNFFFPEGVDVPVDTLLYPSPEYLAEKCAIMYDYGDRTEAFNDAWVELMGNVGGDDEGLPGWAVALIVIGSILVVLGVLGFVFRAKVADFIGKKFPNLLKKNTADSAASGAANAPKPSSASGAETEKSPGNATTKAEKPSPAPSETESGKTAEQHADKKPPAFDDDDDEFIPPVK
ncbi:MAG: extracellular solute-binding protein [Clostridiales bacterium]|jgi:spermidine/putrescine transport system substrate-binding protein|nr:extracellular solute-binding protein [Clostridiales bacterium]